VTAVAATAEALRSARAWQPALNCFVSIEEDGALARAEQVDASPAHTSPLAGVPIAFKDVFVRESGRPRAGSSATVDLGDEPAVVAQVLQAAGTVDIGSLHLDELAYAATGRSQTLGDCRNPWDLRRATGGSSSGPAAAVAARIVPVAIGTDTGGSVRVPAAWCGVLGFKPTYSAISMKGVVPLCPSHDTVGLLATDVAVLRAAYRSLTTAPVPPIPPSPLSPRQATPARPLEGMPMGLLLSGHETGVEDDVLSAVITATGVFEELGAAVHEESMADFDECNAAAAVITASEAGALYEAALHDQPQRYQAGTRTRLRVGGLLSATDYVDATRLRGRAIRRALEGLFSRRAVLIAPVAPTMPPLLEDVASASSTALGNETSSLIRFTRPFNFLGFPSLSVPTGFSPAGLPTAVQLIAAPWRDELLLEVASVLERVIGWSDRHPVLPDGHQVDVRSEPNERRRHASTT
jgi:aspartyl-tRNA(Asn)/glutamyl-tRNA(Gln) amidotransferase subunit A